MRLSILNLKKFVSRLETLYLKNWSQVSENMIFLVFLVPLSILTISRRGKGSGGPGPDIRNRRSILYRIEAEKKKSIFHSNLALGASYMRWIPSLFLLLFLSVMVVRVPVQYL